MRKKLNLATIFIFTFCLGLLAAGFLFPKKIPCANTISCQNSLSLRIENGALGIFNHRRIVPPPISLLDERDTRVLGETTASENKHIYVDLTKQTLSAYDGNRLFMQTFISSGKWFPTPTGDFTIWVKLKSTRMSGGSGDDYYNLPNVPYVLFFSNEQVPQSSGFSLHGTYWHNNFGHPMSHGCVNMRTTDAEKLYHWANPPTAGNTTYAGRENKGTKITIYGEAPI